ncbi:unnamed protein product [Effrenium voratum]|uniref:K Homology domain-containing protein n=1 Tax=Effrenium voratum TaxID=2562239 RepID=A0AA36N2I1_9DINO|nr:unnamed protein product [Effrenium voratum]CAJ1415466.1 unnamed protein product [Effrenium voratum]
MARPRHAFKVLCPEPLASGVLGAKGSNKDRIQDECHCRIVMSNRDEFYPGTRLRLVVVQSDEQDAVLKALDRILDLLAECAETERSNPNGRSAVQGEADFLGKEPEELVLRAAVPIRVGSAIIGPKGSNVKQLQEDCNAKVTIDPNHRTGHQSCRLAANFDGLRMALARISDCLADECIARPQDFEAWASVRSFDRAEDGHGKGRKRSRSPRGARQSRLSPPPYRGKPRGGLEVLGEALGELRSEALDFEYEVTCQLPPEKVSAMIGPGGHIIKSVRHTTGTSIHFDEVHHGAREQTLHIKGPLLGVYRAHVLLMRRYHEHEAELQFGPSVAPKGGKGERKGEKGKREEKGKGFRRESRGKGSGELSRQRESREELQGMLANLERQLNEVKGKLAR